jgi:hypothetical protein
MAEAKAKISEGLHHGIVRFSHFVDFLRQVKKKRGDGG